jgi:glycosyltransferase involved in cell wall biosynthesis
MAVGVPYVVAPVGVAAQLGEPGRTHLEAVTADEWYDALAELLASPTRRSEMGAAGRRYAVEHFSVDHHADEIAEVLRRTAESVR